MRIPLPMLTVAVTFTTLCACATVAETGPAFVELPQFRESHATVYDDARQAMFMAERAYALRTAANDRGEVFETRNGMVRITPEGTAGMWLDCADLARGLSHCAARGKIINGVGEPTQMRSLPTCPGDPRCPRRDANKK